MRCLSGIFFKDKKIKIRIKLRILFLGLMFISLSLMGVILYLLSSSNLKTVLDSSVQILTRESQENIQTEIIHKNQEKIVRVAELIELKVENIENLLKLFVKLEHFKALDKALIKQSFESIQRLMPEITELKMVDDSGQELVITSIEEIIKEENYKNISSLNIFKDTKKSKRRTFISELKTAKRGYAYLELGIPVVKDRRTLTGVLIAKLNLSGIEDMLSRTSNIGEKGYLLITDEKGKILFHPNEELVLKREDISETPLFKAVHSKQKNNIVNMQDGTEVIYVGTKANSLGWYAMAVQPTTEAFQHIENLKKEIHSNASELSAKTAGDFAVYSIAIVAVFLLLAAAVSCCISASLARPVQRITEIADIIAQDDLSGTIPEESYQEEELNTLYEVFRQMFIKFKDIIGQISLNANRVNSSSAELAQITNETSQSIESVAALMQEVQVEYENQVSIAKEAELKIQNTFDLVKEVTTNTESVVDLSAKASKRSVDGNKSIEKIITQMNIINNNVKNSAEMSVLLQERSHKINEVLEIITSIASQTDLLALNASIEAARAGEYGRGFAVVADEVKKLANQSSQAIEQVTDILKDFQAKSGEVAQMLEKSSAEVKEGITNVTTAGSEFSNISSDTTIVQSQVEQIFHTIQEINGQVSSLNEQIKEMAEITAKNSEKNEHIAANVQEQNASAQQVTATAKDLSAMANNLMDIVKKFKL